MQKQTITLSKSFVNGQTPSSISIEFTTDTSIESSLIYDGRLSSTINEAIETINKGFQALITDPKPIEETVAIRESEVGTEASKETILEPTSKPTSEPTSESTSEPAEPSPKHFLEASYNLVIHNADSIFDYNSFGTNIFDRSDDAKRVLSSIARGQSDSRFKHIAQNFLIDNESRCAFILKDVFANMYFSTYRLFIAELIAHHPILSTYIKKGTGLSVMTEMFSGISISIKEIRFLIYECGLMTEEIDLNVFKILVDKITNEDVLALISNLKSLVFPMTFNNMRLATEVLNIIKYSTNHTQEIRNKFLAAIFSETTTV